MTEGSKTWGTPWLVSQTPKALFLMGVVIVTAVLCAFFGNLASVLMIGSTLALIGPPSLTVLYLVRLVAGFGLLLAAMVVFLAMTGLAAMNLEAEVYIDQVQNLEDSFLDIESAGRAHVEEAFVLDDLVISKEIEGGSEFLKDQVILPLAARIVGKVSKDEPAWIGSSRDDDFRFAHKGETYTTLDITLPRGPEYDGLAKVQEVGMPIARCVFDESGKLIRRGYFPTYQSPVTLPHVEMNAICTALYEAPSG